MIDRVKKIGRKVEIDEKRVRERYVKSRLEFNVTIPEADYLPFSGHN